jgi:transposase
VQTAFEVMDWPPYSPDLNLIKNVWKLLKQDIYRRYHDLETARDIADVKERLVAAAKECWGHIKVETLDVLSDSVPNRV